MHYKILSILLMLSVVVATPDWDDYMTQDCGQWDECE